MQEELRFRGERAPTREDFETPERETEAEAETGPPPPDQWDHSPNPDEWIYTADNQNTGGGDLTSSTTDLASDGRERRRDRDRVTDRTPRCSDDVDGPAARVAVAWRKALALSR